MDEAHKRQFLHVDVAETDMGRGYWLDQPWVDQSQRSALLAASVWAVPGRASDGRPIFPSSSEAIINNLRRLLDERASLAVAIRASEYQELAQHARAWRFPIFFVTSIALPFFVDILANRVDELLPGHQAGDTTEATIIIEGTEHKSLKVDYKGDVRVLGQFLKESVPLYIQELEADGQRARSRHRSTHSKKKGDVDGSPGKSP